jgi:hypothetical protein
MISLAYANNSDLAAIFEGDHINNKALQLHSRAMATCLRNFLLASDVYMNALLTDYIQISGQTDTG